MFGVMSEGVNVRFSGALQRHVQERASGSGLYCSASEYIRDLVRRDFEKEEARRWSWLRRELSAGANADESEFVPLDAGAAIEKAKLRGG